MKFVWFSHAIDSCWNNGNAHFLRGIARALLARGHAVVAASPAQGWSRANLVRDHGAQALHTFSSAYPDLVTRTFSAPDEVEALVHGADVVVVHEWNDPWLVSLLAARRRQGARFTLLFHDTHHRAVSDPNAIRGTDLDGFDAVLAFGEALAAIYRGWGWGRRVFVWHEAADTSLFRPPASHTVRQGLVWIGNWGDGERGAEIERFLLAPAREAGLPLDVHGVRYPAAALATLNAHGARYRGWLPNTAVPAVFARHMATIHVPRRFYARALPGIPTIRVFEALACGIPLLTAPWQDSEALFTPGADFLVAADGTAMARLLLELRHDPAQGAALAAHGLATLRARHTCLHRVDELLRILAKLQQKAEAAA